MMVMEDEAVIFSVKFQMDRWRRGAWWILRTKWQCLIRRSSTLIEGGDENRWIIAGVTPLGANAIPPSLAAFLKRCGFPLEGTGVEAHDVEDVVPSEYTSDEEEIEHHARIL